MNILLEIQAHLEQLSPNERKIAEFILKHPNEVVRMSTQELAKQSSTSPATVVRFVKSMGIDGFPQLKMLLSIWSSTIQNNEDFRELEKNEPVCSIKQKLHTRVNHMTELVNKHSDDELLEEVALLIQEAQIIFVFGLGASSLAAQDIMQKFSRLGKTVISEDNIHTMAVLATTNPLKKLFIAISDRGESREVVEMARIAKNAKIPTVVLTGKRESTLAKMADYLLFSASGETFEFRSAATVSLMAQIYLIDLLFYTYVSKNFDDTQELVRKSAKIIHDIEK